MTDTEIPKVEQKHTPGPWKFNGAHNHHDDAAVIDGPNGRPVAYAADFNRFDRDTEKDANAALIAAAPEMYAALINSFVAMGHAGANADTKHPLRAAWEDARAAIARAEGRQP